MPTLDFGVQQTQVMVRVRIRGVGDEIRAREVPSGRFEASDRGVQIDQLFVPWNRVVDYDWIVRQEAMTDRTTDAAKLRVRVVIDDGTPEGETHDIPADRFETSASTLTMLIDRHVEAQSGDLVIQKLFVPWHRVVSYERYASVAGQEPEVVTLPEAAPPTTEAPARPDIP